MQTRPRPAIDFGSIEFGVNDAFVFRNPSGNSIAFLDSNVGVGMTNPSEKLEVNGTIKATSIELTTIPGDIPVGDFQ